MFARSVVAALVAAPIVAQVAFAASCTRQYTVQDGDWCDTISAAQNVSTYQLAIVNANTIDSGCDNLQAGQVLCLGTEGEDCTTTHVVQPDDTCDGITGNYNINATLLYANNPQIDGACDNLYIGEVLCVAPTVAVPSPIAGSPIPAATIPATATPAVVASTSSTSSSAAPTATADDSDDEDDLPWCDEI
ncbi:carbohydrate-binding module family 50 protein [Trametes sanguinea]|nr:carbohydrate-binding module family 50 protein [Trametes sanguinea]